MSFSIKTTWYLGLLIISLSRLQLCLVNADYPGIIELVGYNNHRHARTHLKSNNKMQADIETVKQNIDKYNKLLTLDTNGLPESQKDMLERIVERVARLKESLDINEQQFSSSSSGSGSGSGSGKTTTPITESTATTMEAVESDTVPNIINTIEVNNDETDADDEHNDNVTIDDNDERAAATTLDDIAAITVAVTQKSQQQQQEQQQEQQQSTELPPSSHETEILDTTNIDEFNQLVAARSNNKASITANEPTNTTPLINNLTQSVSTTSGSQRTLTTSAKITKTRATKRPNNINNNLNAQTTIGNNNNKRKTSTISTTINNNNNKQKITATTHPHGQYQQKLQLYQHSSTPQKTTQTQIVDERLTSAVTPQSVTTVDAMMSQRLENTGNSSNIGGSDISQQQQQQQQLPLQPQQPIGNSYSGSLTPNNYNPNNIINNLNAAAANSIGNLNNYNNNNNNDLVYDTKVNASAIINSLNNAREEYYQQQQQLKDAAAGALNGNTNNNNNNLKDKVCMYVCSKCNIIMQT